MPIRTGASASRWRCKWRPAGFTYSTNTARLAPDLYRPGATGTAWPCFNYAAWTHHHKNITGDKHVLTTRETQLHQNHPDRRRTGRHRQPGMRQPGASGRAWHPADLDQWRQGL